MTLGIFAAKATEKTCGYTKKGKRRKQTWCRGRVHHFGDRGKKVPSESLERWQVTAAMTILGLNAWRSMLCLQKRRELSLQESGFVEVEKMDIFRMAKQMERIKTFWEITV